VGPFMKIVASVRAVEFVTRREGKGKPWLDAPQFLQRYLSTSNNRERRLKVAASSARAIAEGIIGQGLWENRPSPMGKRPLGKLETEQ
jgi:hypothetical protein